MYYMSMCVLLLVCSVSLENPNVTFLGVAAQSFLPFPDLYRQHANGAVLDS